VIWDHVDGEGLRKSAKRQYASVYSDGHLEYLYVLLAVLVRSFLVCSSTIRFSESEPIRFSESEPIRLPPLVV